MGELSYTTGGNSNLVSFRSAARVPITSLKAHFKPKQDLHGYSKPWPAGGGKNLFNWNVPEQNPDNTTATNTTARIFTPNTYCVGTSWSNWWQPNQIISYSISNGTITVQNNNVYGIGFAFKLTAETTYVIGATATNGGVSIAYYDSTGTYITTTSANILNTSFTTPADADITVLTFYTTNNSKNGVFTDIQLEKGSSKTSYEPYENICPIEGWNQCDIWHESMYIPLPDEYQRVEYLATNSTNPCGSKIKTGIIGNNKTIVVKYTMIQQIVSSEYPAMIVSSYQNSNNSSMSYPPWATVRYQQQNSGLQTNLSTITPIRGNVNVPNTYIIEFDSTNNYILCGGWNDNQWTKYGKYYSFTIYNNNEIVFNGIPCYRKSDNKPGLFDVISNNFFTNSGTDDFSCGPNIELDKIHINFPVLGKNKLNPNDIILKAHFELVNNIYQNTNVDTRDSCQLAVQLWKTTGTYIKTAKTISNVSTGQFSITFDVDDEECQYICFKYNGLQRDFSLLFPLTLGLRTYTISCNVLSNDPTTIGGVQIENIQLEVGDTATTYEPYDSNNTVYGGYVDIVKGEVVVEWTNLDLGTKTWTYGSADNNFYTTSPSDAFSVYRFNDENNPVMCTAYKSSAAFVGDQIITMNNRQTGTSAVIRIRNSNFTDSDEFKTSLNGTLLYYKLADPIHYPISETELKTFLDRNNLWSNTNDITEVSYQIHDSNMIQQAKRNIAAETNTHYRKVLWNNITNGYMSDNDWKSYSPSVVSATFNDGIASCEVLNTSKIRYTASLVMKTYPPITQNNKYYASYMINPEYQGSFGIEYAAGQQLAGTEMQCPANTWTRRSFVQYGRTNANGAMYIPFPSGYPEGITPRFQIKSPIYINLTAMFGMGNEPTLAEFEHLCEINNVDLTQVYSKDTGTEQLWCIPGHDLNTYSTVTWNQQAMPISSSYYKAYNSEHIAVTFEDDILVSTWLTDGSEYSWSACANYSKTHAVGNYYYLQYEYYTDIDGYIGGDVGGVTTPYVKTQLNQWTKYTTIVQRTSGGNLSNYVVYVNRFSKGGNIPTAGSICKARNIIAIDLTSMFGAGNEPTTAAELYERCLKNNINLDNPQPYKAGEKMIWKV